MAELEQRRRLELGRRPGDPLPQTPGALRLEPLAEYRVSFDAEEILMPIWPLVELMRVDDRP